MRTVFRWAMAHGFMETNPAGEAIDGALPPMPKVKAHLRALPYQEVGSALETVEASQASIPPSCASGSWFSRRRAPVRPGAPPGTRSTLRAKCGEYRPSG